MTNKQAKAPNHDPSKATCIGKTGSESLGNKMTKPKEKKKAARKILTIANLTTPLFDIYPPVKRKWKGNIIIEGVTKTDNFQVVGFTYWPNSGFLVIKNTLNRILFQGKVNNMTDVGKAMKKADKA